MKTLPVFCGRAICVALILAGPAAVEASIELTLDCVVSRASSNAAALASEVRLFVKVDSTVATIIKGVHEFELTYDRELTLSELTLIAYGDLPREKRAGRPLFGRPAGLPRIGVSRLTGEGYFTFYERLPGPPDATAQWELIIVRMQCERVPNERRVF